MKLTSCAPESCTTKISAQQQRTLQRPHSSLTRHTQQPCSTSSLVIRSARNIQPMGPSIVHRRSHGSHLQTCFASQNSDFDLTETPAPAPPSEELPRDDEVLPDSLADAVMDAASATADAIMRSNNKCQVEILMPEFWDPSSGPIFPNQGDQERFWAITRRFVENLGTALKVDNVRAVYPDAGVAAMLTYQWKDAKFKISSLNDRRPVSAEDELVIVTCPDPPGADECRKLVSQLAEQDEANGIAPRPVVLFNQRLAGGDVGVGLNARRMRSTFLEPFVVTYSLRPVGETATVFRKYPEQWKVFVEEESMPGRFRLAKETPSRPAGEALDMIISTALDLPPPGSAPGEVRGPSFVNTLLSTLKGVQRFMKGLSN